MGARVTQVVAEVAIPIISRSPTTVTGAGVTQVVVEAALRTPGIVRVSQVILEAAFKDDGTPGQGTGYDTLEVSGGET